MGIEENILLMSHSLEKGMGLPNPHPGFGFETSVKLLGLLEEYISLGMDTKRYVFIEGVSVLNAYLDITNNDFSIYDERIKKVNDLVNIYNVAGIIKVADMNAVYKKIDREQIKHFISSRHSIRSFSSANVDEIIMNEVIEFAAYAPSACNRQPVKVYWTSNPDTVKKINGLIPGNKGFENEIYNWAFITADRKMFGITEPLQWYVNGGIYLAYFVEALHTFGIGSCIFQIPSIHKNTPLLIKIASIPENEAFIAAVGFGYPKRNNKFLAASRRPIREVLVKF